MVTLAKECLGIFRHNEEDDDDDPAAVVEEEEDAAIELTEMLKLEDEEEPLEEDKGMCDECMAP